MNTENPHQSCLDKQNQLINEFSDCQSSEATYTKIISLGKQLKSLSDQKKSDHLRIQGCQSLMYMNSSLKDDKVYFEAESDALISAGLAMLLIRVYSGESPETILQCPPDFLTTLNIPASLSPSRANGLANIHLRMKQDALKFLLENAKQNK